METSTLISILLSLLCIVLLTLIFKAFNWVWLNPKKLEIELKQQGIPGTHYKFLFGDLKDSSSMKSLALEKPLTCLSHDYLSRIDPLHHQLFIHFGKIYFMWAGTTPMIRISQPELIRETLTRMHEFRKPNLNPIVDKVFTGFLNYEGEKWAKHRKLINPAFHMEKLKLMLPAFFSTCEEMINKWEKIVAETGSGELDVWPYLVALSADVISRAAFGSSYVEGQRIFQLLKEQIGLGLLTLRSVYIPGSRYIPTATNRRISELDNQIQTLLKGIINKRKKAIEAREAATKSDLLGILMDSNSKEIEQATGSKNQEVGMSLQEVIDECKLFYLAGQETTSILLVWTLILLSKHQDWQARAREEVLQTFGNTTPDFEGLNRLKTVTMILNEVLRLYPPAPQLNRRVYKDSKLGKLSLPAGAIVNLQVILVHRDKEIWGDDAEEFKPDRFSEGITKAAKGSNAAFFPFGWGPRICIGEKFAIIEAKMALSMILHRFWWEISPSYAHAPITVFFLQPQHGAHIILHRL